MPITNQKRPGMIVRGMRGDPESVFDTYTYTNTDALEQNLFTTYSGRTLNLTNMTDAGKLPTGKSLVVKSFNVYVYMPTVLTDAKVLKLYAFLETTTVEFIKENRSSSFTKTLAMLLGLSFVIQHVPTTAGDNVLSPEPFFRGKMAIKTRALDLGANQTFKVRQLAHAALDADLNGLQVKYEIDGLMSKKITS